MQVTTMNQSKNRMTGVMAPSAPLFASSWVALFSFLRHSLGKDQDDREQSSKTVDAGAKHSKH